MENQVGINLKFEGIRFPYLLSVFFKICINELKSNKRSSFLVILVYCIKDDMSGKIGLSDGIIKELYREQVEKERETLME